MRNKSNNLPQPELFFVGQNKISFSFGSAVPEPNQESWVFRRSNNVQVFALILQLPHLIQFISILFLLDMISHARLLIGSQEELGVQIANLVVFPGSVNVKSLVEPIV